MFSLTSVTEALLGFLKFLFLLMQSDDASLPRTRICRVKAHEKPWRNPSDGLYGIKLLVVALLLCNSYGYLRVLVWRRAFISTRPARCPHMHGDAQAVYLTWGT